MHFGVEHGSQYTESEAESPDIVASKSIDLELILKAADEMQADELLSLTQQLFALTLKRNKIENVPNDFIEVAVTAMTSLRDHEQCPRPVNLIYKFALIIAKNRIPLDRMPWGLIQYNVEFFYCNDVNEVRNQIFFVHLTCLLFCFIFSHFYTFTFSPSHKVCSKT